MSNSDEAQCLGIIPTSYVVSPGYPDQGSSDRQTNSIFEKLRPPAPGFDPITGLHDDACLIQQPTDAFSFSTWDGGMNALGTHLEAVWRPGPLPDQPPYARSRNAHSLHNNPGLAYPILESNNVLEQWNEQDIYPFQQSNSSRTNACEIGDIDEFQAVPQWLQSSNFQGNLLDESSGFVNNVPLDRERLTSGVFHATDIQVSSFEPDNFRVLNKCLQGDNVSSLVVYAVHKDNLDANDRGSTSLRDSPQDTVAYDGASSHTLSAASSVTAPCETPIRKASTKQPRNLAKDVLRQLHPSSRVKFNRRGGPLGANVRAGAAAMRKHTQGPCVRCRLYKIRCDLNNPCTNCIKSLPKARSFLLPCNRAGLTSIHLVRHGFGRFGQNEATFIEYRWVRAYDKPAQLCFDWFLPGARQVLGTRSFKLPVRKYVADGLDSDTTSYRWRSSEGEQCVRVPAFACCDNNKVRDEVAAFITNSQIEVDQCITDSHRNDEIARITYDEANRYVKEYGSDLISAALALQRGTIISQGVGSVTLESLRILLDDPHCDDISNLLAFDGDDRGQQRPVPLAVQHQIEVAILEHMSGLQKELLDRMDHIFYGRKPRQFWYQFSLAFFILLSNLEWIYSGALRYKRMCEQTEIEPKVSNVIHRMVEEYRTAAKAVFYHFRHILHGPLPFQLIRDYRHDPATLHELLVVDDTGLLYLQRLMDLLDNKATMHAGMNDEGVDEFIGEPDGLWIRELLRRM